MTPSKTEPCPTCLGEGWVVPSTRGGFDPDDPEVPCPDCTEPVDPAT